MARLARLVVPGIPHHVTHRGNRRADIFLDEEDRDIYRRVLARFIEKSGCALWAYCLMPNHVHLLVVPREESSLARGVGVAHQRYAQIFNRRHRETGHLFEGRYYSTPLDDRHTWTAVRYIERNPVRARLVARAEDWPWSSAHAHIARTPDALLDPARPFPDPGRTGGPWADWLAIAAASDAAEEARLRSRTLNGRPCGDAAWVREVEQLTGRGGLGRRPGRPRLRQEDQGSEEESSGSR